MAPGCASGELDAPYLGCFHDRRSHRALSREVDGADRAEECRDWCEARGYRYFGREWRGQCFCGNRHDYDKHGRATGCDCCGEDVGNKKICVWEAR